MSDEKPREFWIVNEQRRQWYSDIEISSLNDIVTHVIEHAAYDQLRLERDALAGSLKLAVQAIENYCNAHHVWSINKNHMTYQGSNEQQFLDALAKIKARHGDLK